MTTKTQPIETTTEDLLESLKKTTKKAKTLKAQIKVVKHPHTKLPSKKTKGAAAYDVYANTNLPIWINPGEVKLVSTGLKVSIPEGYMLELYPRSGLAIKGITLVNCVGIIDSDYRDEIMVALINFGTTKYQINKQDRIAQLILRQLTDWSWEQVDALDETDRPGGFGSTGV